jgi:hypothetical protein
MRLIISVIICAALLGCNSSDYSKIELISTSGRALDYNHTDSLIFGLYIHAYAQIDKDGNCLTVRRINPDCSKFDSFRIDNNMIQIINERLSKINSDTFLTVKSDGEIYDGPTIQLLVHKDNGTVNRLTFIKSKRTDKDFLRLYKYIDSISLNNSNRLFDTTKLKSDRDKLINQMKQDILKSGNTFDRDTIVIIK